MGDLSVYLMSTDDPRPDPRVLSREERDKLGTPQSGHKSIRQVLIALLAHADAMDELLAQRDAEIEQLHKANNDTWDELVSRGWAKVCAGGIRSMLAPSAITIDLIADNAALFDTLKRFLIPTGNSITQVELRSFLAQPHPGAPLLAERDELKERIKALEQENDGLSRLYRGLRDAMTKLLPWVRTGNDFTTTDHDLCRSAIVKARAALAESPKPAKEKP